MGVVGFKYWGEPIAFASKVRDTQITDGGAFGYQDL